MFSGGGDVPQPIEDARQITPAVSELNISRIMPLLQIIKRIVIDSQKSAPGVAAGGRVGYIMVGERSQQASLER
jgi:hypothetical protein